MDLSSSTIEGGSTDRAFLGKVPFALALLLSFVACHMTAVATETRDELQILFWNTKGLRLEDTEKMEVMVEVADGVDVAGFAEMGKSSAFEALVRRLGDSTRSRWLSALTGKRGKRFGVGLSPQKIGFAAGARVHVSPVQDKTLNGFVPRPEAYPHFSRLPVVLYTQGLPPDCETVSFTLVFGHLTAKKQVDGKLAELRELAKLRDTVVRATKDEDVVILMDMNLEGHERQTRELVARAFSGEGQMVMVVGDEPTFVTPESCDRTLDWALVSSDLAATARIEVSWPEGIAPIASWTVVSDAGTEHSAFDHAAVVLTLGHPTPSDSPPPSTGD